ncbi:MAG: MlaD family protein [Candidatus Melainabacteria bacterium]|nr:MlaD family protein [Candidatus Melainabacteria bacterium]
MKRQSLIQVGLFTLVSLALLVFVLIWLRGRGIQPGITEEVLFQDVDGMRPGAAVQMMGIRVGFVETIQPRVIDGRYYVAVTYSVTRNNTHIPKGSTIAVEQSGLIGEKFLEITPPQLHEVEVSSSVLTPEKLLASSPAATTAVSTPAADQPAMGALPNTMQPMGLSKDAGPAEDQDSHGPARWRTPRTFQPLPVKMQFLQGLHRVGWVERVEPLITPTSVDVNPGAGTNPSYHRYRLFFRVTLPGASLPREASYSLAQAEQNGAVFLKITPKPDKMTHLPDKNLEYTIINPLRMKYFLDVQMESAESLKETNEKIVQLLSDENLDTLTDTLKNIRTLTARGTRVLDSADRLFVTTSKDLELLVHSAETLTDNMTELSQNINDVLGDPQFKQDFIATTHSLEQASSQLNALLQDPALQETIQMTRDTSANVAELTATLRKTAQDPALQQRLDTSLTLLNDSLTKLGTVLDSVETLASDDDQNLKNILKETRETSANLKEFSKRLNGRFLLFRLMF